MGYRSSENKPLFNINAFLQFVLLFSFLSFVIWLDITNQLPLYINPKFIVLTEISCCLLVPIIILCFFDIMLSSDTHHGHSHTGQFQYIPFFVVLILAAAVPDNTLNASLAASKGLNTTPTINKSSQIIIAPRPLANELQRSSFIHITAQNFTEAISEITDYPKDYLGKKVALTGFVFRTPEHKSNQISLVRYVMTCCVADSLPYGIMCEVKDAQNYQNGSWLSIEGTLQISKYGSQDTPCIKISSLEKVPEPSNPYVFPYGQ